MERLCAKIMGVEVSRLESRDNKLRELLNKSVSFVKIATARDLLDFYFQEETQQIMKDLCQRGVAVSVVLPFKTDENLARSLQARGVDVYIGTEADYWRDKEYGVLDTINGERAFLGDCFWQGFYITSRQLTIQNLHIYYERLQFHSRKLAFTAQDYLF